MRTKPEYRLYDYYRAVDEDTDTVIYWGHQVGNPKFEPGAWIHTSTVMKESKDEIVTQNSIYKLVTDEDVDEAMEKIKDDAMTRVLNNVLVDSMKDRNQVARELLK